MASLTASKQRFAPGGPTAAHQDAWVSAAGLKTVPWHAVVAVLLAVLGVFSISSTALYLWDLWTTDPLKSIGGFVPLVSLWLILRVWRALGWESRGSWWGLVLLAGTVMAVHLRDHAILELVLTASWSIFLPPHSLVAFAYVSGVVLLFGGTLLYRAALFPILLILLVNPVPHVFNRFIDLPLQHASAATARAFAHALGQRLTPDQLHLMFTPDFGMFIAPGCNGIRGSITMGFIALVAGYLYRFRAKAWVLTVAMAVLLGYVFNLCRLCVLVLYYVIALHLPWLQNRAEMGDYLIGASLFFFATILLFAVVRRFNAGDLRPPTPRFRSVASSASAKTSAPWRHATAFAVLTLLGSVSYARAFARDTFAHSRNEAATTFPAQIGGFRLRRTWSETLVTGQTIFKWSEYAVPNADTAVMVGVSPTLGAHDTLLCHAARGDDWLWHGTVPLATADGEVDFSSSLFNDGATQYMEATTVCSGAHCGQWSSERRHFGLVYSHPDARALLSQSPSRPIPILLRVETTDLSLSAPDARLLLTAQLRTFARASSIPSLTQPWR